MGGRVTGTEVIVCAWGEKRMRWMEKAGGWGGGDTERDATVRPHGGPSPPLTSTHYNGLFLVFRCSSALHLFSVVLSSPASVAELECLPSSFFLGPCLWSTHRATIHLYRERAPAGTHGHPRRRGLVSFSLCISCCGFLLACLLA